MPKLSDYSIVLPKADLSPECWEKNISSAPEAEKLLVQRWYLILKELAKIEDFTATPERMAWMAMWQTAKATWRATQVACEGDSSFLTEMLSRSLTEAFLRSETIVYPFSIQPDPPTAATESAVTDRLRAYTAWCLWNDRLYLQEFGDGRTMRNNYDASLARNIVNDENFLKGFKVFFGETVPLVTDQEQLDENRRQANYEINTAASLISDFLEDESLSGWVAKLHQLEKEYGNAIPFPALFPESQFDKGVKRRLYQIGHRHHYHRYMKQSALLHHSTLMNWFSVAPKEMQMHFGIPRSDDHEASICYHAVHTQLLFLLMLFPRAWGRTTSEQ